MSTDQTELGGCLLGLLSGAALVLGYQHFFPSKPVKLTPTADQLRPIGTWDVASSRDGDVWTLDADSVRGDRARRQGWVKTVYQKPMSMIKTRQALVRVNCETTEFQTLSASYLDTANRPLFAGESYQKAESDYAAPGSINSAIIDKLCLPGFDLPVTFGQKVSPN